MSSWVSGICPPARPPRQLDYLRAIHEAGHAVAALLGRGHLHSAQITKGTATSTEGGITDCCNLNDGHAFAVFCAAGERATDRWLREAGLWTPERAVAAEVGARGDRHLFLSINPDVGFGDRQIDYRVVHDLADQAIDQQWPAITAVADALVQRQHNEIAPLPRRWAPCSGLSASRSHRCPGRCTSAMTTTPWFR
jgi:hypothetical protein